MKKKILFLAANPTDTMQLRLTKEAREVKHGLERSQYRDDFEFESEWAVRIKDVQRAMLDFKPNIVHFCGHGAGEAGIVFEDDAGASHLVTADALANFFALFADNVECVVLNACYSEVQAKSIAWHIPHVIGMSQAIEDHLAINFATAFYDALGAGRPTEFAYRFACNSMQLSDASKELIPVLITKKDVTAQLYDILISSNEKDRAWVNQNLYAPLAQCQYADGCRPVIYFGALDKPEALSSDLAATLEKFWQALQGSRAIIPVYTRAYFEDKKTNWQLKKIVDLDVYDDKRKIHPLLVEAGVDVSPFYKSSFGFLDVSNPRWFNELISALGLTYQAESNPLLVVFASQPPATLLELAIMPALIVEVRDENGISNVNSAITLTVEKGEAQGTLTRPLQNGRAVFDDLFFTAACEQTRFSARMPDTPAVYSQAFNVLSVPPPAETRNAELATGGRDFTPVTLTAQGDVVFFASSNAFALIKTDKIEIYARQGDLLNSLTFNDRVRFTQTYENRLIVAGWGGKVGVLYDDGRSYIHSFAKRESGFCVPSAAACHGEDNYISFWGGAVQRLTVDKEPVLVAHHEVGIHTIQPIGADLLAICDLDGQLLLMQNGKVIWAHPLEKNVLLLQSFADCLIAVGEKRLYHLTLPGKVFSEEAQPTAALSALGGTQHIFIMDVHGRCARYSPDLVAQSSFRVAPGYQLVSMDAVGKHIILEHPEKGWILVLDRQVSSEGNNTPLAISPRGDFVSLNQAGKIHIMSVADAQRNLAEGTKL